VAPTSVTAWLLQVFAEVGGEGGSPAAVPTRKLHYLPQALDLRRLPLLAVVVELVRRHGRVCGNLESPVAMPYPGGLDLQHFVLPQPIQNADDPFPVGSQGGRGCGGIDMEPVLGFLGLAEQISGEGVARSLEARQYFP